MSHQAILGPVREAPKLWLIGFLVFYPVFIAVFAGIRTPEQAQENPEGWFAAATYILEPDADADGEGVRLAIRRMQHGTGTTRYIPREFFETNEYARIVSLEEKLRGLVGAAARGGLDVQLAPILDVDLDPSRQRLLLNAGARDGVRQGQTVIDAGGLLGQIIAVTPDTATVLLLTDLDHAVPVSISRTGVRLLAYGIGRSDRLELRNIPVSGDVQVGDVVVTSGLGGRFPAGFPVGRIVDLRPDDSQAFLIGELAPTAQLDRGRDVLLLRESRDPASGPGSPESGTAEAAGRQSDPPASASDAQPGTGDATNGATQTGTAPDPARPGQPENASGPGVSRAPPGPAVEPNPDPGPDSQAPGR